MTLIRTNLSCNGARVWLETADSSIVQRIEYQYGELMRPCQLIKEPDNGEKRRIEEVDD